jgi:1-acyl-sn-glycerol-3-phosphate acyltransferase
MLHTAFIGLWTLIVTFYYGLAAIAVSFIDSSGIASHKVAQIWGRSILFASRIKVKVRGLHHIHPDQSYIYMCNHQSNIDIPVLLGCLGVQFRWLAKAELFKVPLFGYAMQRAGYISIDRSNRKSAIRSLNQAAITIRNGVSVIIFPEGTRSVDGRIRQFKKGGFVLAVDAGVPVIPVVVHGTRAIMAKKKLRVTPGPVLVDILNPIDTQPYSRKDKDLLLGRVRNVIVSQFEKGFEGGR